MQLTPYLNFDGQCEAAFKFYEQCFGGKIVAMLPFEGTPAAEHVPAEARKLIMHACMEIDGAMLMASDSPSGDYEPPKGIWVSLHLKNVADAERIFRALEDGGTVQMPMEETFWAARFGMVTDRFGTPWMINCEKAG